MSDTDTGIRVEVEPTSREDALLQAYLVYQDLIREGERITSDAEKQCRLIMVELREFCDE
jgi:hypothetical protein